MRQIINSTYISLDGVIQDPHLWPSTETRDERGLELQTQLLSDCDAVVMGRRTYEAFAPAWSARSGDAYSDRINSMAKYVVSSTLRDPDWNNTSVISGDPVEEIRRIRSQPGMNIVQYGFGQLSHALMDHGLLDELRLWVHPFFVRKGGPADLIYREGPLTSWTLRDVLPLKSGIVVLTYAKR